MKVVDWVYLREFEQLLSTDEEHALSFELNRSEGSTHRSLQTVLEVEVHGANTATPQPHTEHFLHETL